MPHTTNRSAVQRDRDRSAALRAAGVPNARIFETLTSESLQRKEMYHVNRCRNCWHDKSQRCICSQLRPIELTRRIKVLILMHSSEYLAPGDDAKLILALLPRAQASLFIFGRPGDDDALKGELAEDPAHTLLLWPGPEAVTIDTFIDGLPESSPWHACRKASSAAAADELFADQPSASDVWPMLRVVCLDGLYNDARTMYRHFYKRLQPPAHPVRTVALHPSTLSVYHRATSNYGAASASDIARNGNDPLALRICTVEAVALLLQELGEPSSSTDELVNAVLLNNDAVAGRMRGRSERERRASRWWRAAIVAVMVPLLVVTVISRRRIG